MILFLNIYIAVMVVMFLTAGFFFIEASFKERKIGSRLMLIAPVWPMLAPVLFCVGVRYFWRHADWRGAREEEEEERLKRGRSSW